MGWYLVTKTVKGRKYRYRQRSFRVAGKVKTESIYLGPVGPATSRSVSVASHEAEKPSTVAIIDGTPIPDGDASPSLTVDDFMDVRSDISIQALYREEQQVDDLMKQSGIITTNLKQITVKQDLKVWRRERRDEYVVYGTYEGQRTAFKREYRRALAERWLDAVRDQQPERYQRLCQMVSLELGWTYSGAEPQWLALLGDLWQQRRRGHREAVEMLAEIMQRGRVATQAKYYWEDGEAEKAEINAWKKFERLKRPAARNRQFAEWKRLKAVSQKAGVKHLHAMWVRARLFDERPIVSPKDKAKYRPKKKKRTKIHRYRRRRYPRWSR